MKKKKVNKVGEHDFSVTTKDKRTKLISNIRELNRTGIVNG